MHTLITSCAELIIFFLKCFESLHNLYCVRHSCGFIYEVPTWHCTQKKSPSDAETVRMYAALPDSWACIVSLIILLKLKVLCSVRIIKSKGTIKGMLSYLACYRMAGGLRTCMIHLYFLPLETSNCYNIDIFFLWKVFMWCALMFIREV